METVAANWSSLAAFQAPSIGSSFSPQTQQTTSTSWGLPGDQLFPPVDLEGEGAANTVIMRDGGSFRVVFGLLGNGNTKTWVIPTTGTPLIGNFSGVPQAELALFADGRAFGADTAILYRYDGAVAAVSFPQSPGAGDLVSPAFVPQASTETPTSGDFGCNEIKSFQSPELWKPFSDGVPGNAVVLFHRSLFSQSGFSSGVGFRRLCSCRRGPSQVLPQRQQSALLAKQTHTKLAPISSADCEIKLQRWN